MHNRLLDQPSDICYWNSSVPYLSQFSFCINRSLYNIELSKRQCIPFPLKITVESHSFQKSFFLLNGRGLELVQGLLLLESLFCKALKSHKVYCVLVLHPLYVIHSVYCLVVIWCIGYRDNVGVCRPMTPYCRIKRIDNHPTPSLHRQRKEYSMREGFMNMT